MKILIINNNNTITHFKEYSITNLSILRPLNFYERIIKRIPLINNIFSETYWERKGWENLCKDKDVIILFDQLPRNYSISQRIQQSCSASCRLIIFYWNPYFFTKDNHLLSDRWEKWSFSKKDAKLFNMRYAGTFFPDYYLDKSFTNNTKSNHPEAFFVGLNKGRSYILNKLSKLLTQRNIYCNFILVHNFYSLFLKKYSKRLTYAQVIENVKHCTYLVDIVQEKQEGLTQRVMESLFFEKKLITNNIEICSYDFYNPTNIFIFDNVNNECLDSFLSTDYVKINNEILNSYKFTSWLDRNLKHTFNN